MSIATKSLEIDQLLLGQRRTKEGELLKTPGSNCEKEMLITLL